MSSLLESGHYYLAKGPTIWSLIGWKILQNLKQKDDKTLLFIDDIHTLEELNKREACENCIEFAPNPDFLVLESEVYNEAYRVLELLQTLPNKKRAKQHLSGQWFYSGFPITNQEGVPLCVLLDAGLCLKKYELGFSKIVNILPEYYTQEQTNLMRILKRALPDVSLSVVSYDLQGNWHCLEL